MLTNSVGASCCHIGLQCTVAYFALYWYSLLWLVLLVMLILCFRWSVYSAVSVRWKVVSSTSSKCPSFLWKNKWRTSRCCLCWLWEHWNYSIHKVSITRSLFFYSILGWNVGWVLRRLFNLFGVAGCVCSHIQFLL